jgi:hypothetical protein
MYPADIWIVCIIGGARDMALLSHPASVTSNSPWLEPGFSQYCVQDAVTIKPTKRKNFFILPPLIKYVI